ncbi:hypothetical protein MBLNU459_g5571t1 [Dothideomycetes sp. NU459]
MPQQPSQPSSRSSPSRDDDYAISLNIWGRGDPAQGDDPSHWGLMIYKWKEQRGQLHHVQKHEDFFYATRENVLESQSSRGRSELVRLSLQRKDRANAILDEYGRDPGQVLRLVNGRNCQDWTAGALRRLEEEHIVPKGSEAFWRSQKGKSAEAIGSSLRQNGKSWIPVHTKKPSRPADARFNQSGERRATGRLNMAAFEKTTAR